MDSLSEAEKKRSQTNYFLFAFADSVSPKMGSFCTSQIYWLFWKKTNNAVKLKHNINLIPKRHLWTFERKYIFLNFQELSDVKNQRLQLAQDEFNHLHSTLSNISAVSTTSRKNFSFKNFDKKKKNSNLHRDVISF